MVYKPIKISSIGIRPQNGPNHQPLEDSYHRDLVLYISLDGLRGWDAMFIRNLQQRARICKRDGKRFKLSDRQINQWQRIEGVSK